MHDTNRRHAKGRLKKPGIMAHRLPGTNLRSKAKADNSDNVCQNKIISNLISPTSTIYESKAVVNSS